MIKSAGQMRVEIKSNMRGGDGDVRLLHFLEQGDYSGKARLTAKITLEKGCSIGYHIHENEEEIFYIISGSGVYCDNGLNRAVVAGDSTLTKSGEGHSMKNTGDIPLDFLAVILTL